MKTSRERLSIAMQYGMANRPETGGFPFLAECLRLAGVKRNLWLLPSAQSFYVMGDGAIANQGTPLVSDTADVPTFDREALVAALRIDQAGRSGFPEFLAASWRAGVVSYDVDFDARTVTYNGVRGESHQESYPEIEITELEFE